MTDRPFPYGHPQQENPQHDSPAHGNPPPCDFESQYRRVFEAAGCRTQAELAAILDIRQSSISDAKRRKSIPVNWLLALREKKGISLEWVLYGRGEMYCIQTDSEHRPHVPRVIEIRPPEECSAQDLINELVRRALQK